MNVISDSVTWHLLLLLLFDDNKVKMARKTEKKQKENPVGCTGEGKIWRGNKRKGYREDKTGTACSWVWRWGDPWDKSLLHWEFLGWRGERLAHMSQCSIWRVMLTACSITITFWLTDLTRCVWHLYIIIFGSNSYIISQEKKNVMPENTYI